MFAQQTKSGPQDAFFQSAPIALLVVNREGRIVAVNSEAEDVCDYTRDELLDQSIELLVPDEYRKRHSEYVQRFFASPKPVRLGIGRELFAQRKDGSTFPVELGLGPAQIDDELFVVVTVVDITERKRIEREFGVARQIQEALLPTEAPRLPHFDVAGMCRPAHETGGDFFDYVPLSRHRLAIVVGDAMGHGFGPALLTATVRSSIRTLLRTLDGSSDVLRSANELLSEDSPGDLFITCVLIELDAASRSLVYSAAGHDAYVVGTQGQVRHHLLSTGMPMGIRATERYQLSNRVSLESGDIVLLCSDGLYEGRSPTGQVFGKEHLLDVIRECRGCSAEEIIDVLKRSISDFTEGCEQEDDITIVVARVTS